MARMTFKRMWLALCLCAFPALGFAGQGMGVQRQGPYDIRILKDFQNEIVNVTFRSDWCSSEPLVYKVFLEDSCDSFLVSDNSSENRWYYIIVGKPANRVVAPDYWDARVMGGSLKSRVADIPNADDLGFANSHDQTRVHHARPVPYNDQVAFLIEVGEAGRILDSTFFVFYELANFENRGIKPDYSNFVNVEKYILSVKKHSQGMGFEDVIMLVEEGGMKIHEKTDSHAVFVTPINPYKPHSSIEEIRKSIELRSGIIINPNSPNYAQVRVSGSQLVFETSVNGGQDTWRVVK